MIEPDHSRLSIVRQCALVRIARSSHYYTGKGESTLKLMRLLDAQFLSTPWYGSRQMARHLRRQGEVDQWHDEEDVEQKSVLKLKEIVVENVCSF